MGIEQAPPTTAPVRLSIDVRKKAQRVVVQAFDGVTFAGAMHAGVGFSGHSEKTSFTMNPLSFTAP